MARHLYRSRQNKILGGVCGGIAEYFGLDSTLVRILYILLCLLPGIGVLSYILLWIIIPRRPIEEDVPREEPRLSPLNRYLPGIILIAFGLVLLFREYVYHFTWGDLWPVILIALGLGLIVLGNARRSEQPAREMKTSRVNGQSGGLEK